MEYVITTYAKMLKEFNFIYYDVTIIPTLHEA